MANTNIVLLAGNLTRNPDARRTNSGTTVCNLGLAVNKKWRDQQGQQRESTLFVDIEVWGKQADFCRDYLGKGASVLIEGELESQQWEDKTTGQQRHKLVVKARNVQALDKRPAHNGANTAHNPPQPPAFPS